MYVGAVVIALGAMRLAYLKWTGGSTQNYQLLSILPISASSRGTHSGSNSPTGSSESGSCSPNFEQLALPPHVQSDIASAFRRAGNIIVAAPASLLPGDRRGGRRRTGLLYFVPALLLPGPSWRKRPRTASEASQLPLRRPRRDRDQIDPPPYDGPPLKRPSEDGLEEVDAFLKDADETATSTTGTDVPTNEAAWAEWGKDGKH